MSSPSSPEHYDRRATLIEDVVNLACLASLFLLLMLKPRIPAGAVMPLMTTLLVVTGVLFVRRKARVDRLFRRMREEQQAGQAGLPFVPSAPPRMTEPPASAKKKSKVKR